MGDYSYLEAWRAAAARMWPGEHGSRSFGECARCALAAEHGCLSPDQLHVTYWHVWASEWLIDFRLGACAGRGAVLAPHQRPRAKELRGRVYAAQLTSCAHVLPSSLPPLDLGPRGPRTTLHALPSLRTALRSPAAHFFSPTPPRLLRPYLAAELNPQPCAAQVSYVILGALRRTLYHVLAFPNLLSGSVRGGRE